MPNFSISLTNEPHKWIHSRTVFSKWGSHNIEKLKEAVGKDGYKEFWRKKEAPKNRYIQILGQTKGETKKLKSKLKVNLLILHQQVYCLQLNLVAHQRQSLEKHKSGRW